MVFILTFICIFLSLIGLGIGYFVTGKSKLHKKCGSNPEKNTKDCNENGCDACKK